MSRPIDHVAEQRPIAEEPSLGDLFAELSRETTTLVRQEMELAKVELSQKAAVVGKDVGFLAAGGAVLYAGFLALIAAIIVGLGQAGLPWWVSALIVGLAVSAVGAYLVWTGIIDLRGQNLAPTNTLATLKEDTQWTKEQIH